MDKELLQKIEELGLDKEKAITFYKFAFSKGKTNTIEQLISLFNALSHQPDKYPWSSLACDYLKSI